MKYRALVSFTGTISMAGGEVREISDLTLAENLLKCGYIEEIAPKNIEHTADEAVEKKAKTPRRKKTDGN